jgi:hypothetical protein
VLKTAGLAPTYVQKGKSKKDTEYMSHYRINRTNRVHQYTGIYAITGHLEIIQLNIIDKP